MKKISLYGSLIGVIAYLMSPSLSFAESCFPSSEKLNEDAQNLRLHALDMGWTMGKAASLAAAVIIEGKGKLYPKDYVEVCLREQENNLQIKAQSNSEDAGKAQWHKIHARKEQSRKGFEL